MDVDALGVNGPLTLLVRIQLAETGTFLALESRNTLKSFLK